MVKKRDNFKHIQKSRLHGFPQYHSGNLNQPNLNKKSPPLFGLSLTWADTTKKYLTAAQRGEHFSVALCLRVSSPPKKRLTRKKRLRLFFSVPFFLIG